jgi:hypothetical protein
MRTTPRKERRRRMSCRGGVKNDLVDGFVFAKSMLGEAIPKAAPPLVFRGGVVLEGAVSAVSSRTKRRPRSNSFREPHGEVLEHDFARSPLLFAVQPLAPRACPRRPNCAERITWAASPSAVTRASAASRCATRSTSCCRSAVALSSTALPRNPPCDRCPFHRVRFGRSECTRGRRVTRAAF